MGHFAITIIASQRFEDTTRQSLTALATAPCGAGRPGRLRPCDTRLRAHRRQGAFSNRLMVGFPRSSKAVHTLAFQNTLPILPPVSAEFDCEVLGQRTCRPAFCIE